MPEIRYFNLASSKCQSLTSQTFFLGVLSMQNTRQHTHSLAELHAHTNPQNWLSGSCLILQRGVVKFHSSGDIVMFLDQ